MAYVTGKNPFEDGEDVDDFSFSRGAYGGGNSRNGFGENKSRNPLLDNDSGASGYDSAMSKYEQIQQMKENSMNNQLESMNRAMASLHDSEATGIATAEELVQQGEQLDNTENNLDKINQDMKTSQKHLNGIKSIFGGIKNWWTSGKKGDEPTTQPTKVKSESAAGLQKAMDNSIQSGVKPGPHPAFRIGGKDGLYDEEDELDSQFMAGAGPSHRYNQGRDGPMQYSSGTSDQMQTQKTQSPVVKSGKAPDTIFDENLDVMSSGMSRLKGLAQGLGQELERQNDQVERITSKADRSDIKLNDQNRQMRKILK